MSDAIQCDRCGQLTVVTGARLIAKAKKEGVDVGDVSTPGGIKPSNVPSTSNFPKPGRLTNVQRRQKAKSVSWADLCTPCAEELADWWNNGTHEEEGSR